MKQNIIKLWTLGAMFAAVACSKADPEVIIEDPAYQLDPKEIAVSKPEPFVYNESNILRNVSAKDVTFDAILIDGQVTMEETTIPLTFRLRRPLKEALTIKLEKDASLFSKYTGDRTNVQDFPEDTFEGLTITIPAGKVVHEAQLTIKNVERLTNTNGYLVAFRYNVPNSVSLAEEASSLFVRVNVKEPKYLLLDAKEDAWVEMTSDQFSRSITPNYGGGYVRDTSKLTISKSASASGATIAGISLQVNLPSYAMKSFRIKVYNETVADGETFDLITLPSPKRDIFIKFTKPLTYNKIELSEFAGFNSRWAEILDIKLYTKP